MKVKNTVFLVVFLLLLQFKMQGQILTAIETHYEANDSVYLRMLCPFYGPISQPPYISGVVTVQSQDTLHTSIYFWDPNGGATNQPAPWYKWHVADLGKIPPHGGLNYIKIYPYRILHGTDTTVVGLPTDTTVSLSWAPTGIDDTQHLRGGIKIFPNPVGDQLSVANISEKELTGDIVITDVTSKIVYSDKQRMIGQSPLTINTRKFTSGTYFISVTDNNKRQYNYRFTKL